MSRIRYVLNVFTDVVDHIPQKRILRPWNQREAETMSHD